MPSNVIPSIIYRREGQLAVAIEGPIYFGSLFVDVDKPKELRLVVIYNTHRVVSEFVKIKPHDESFYIHESFHFAVTDTKDEQYSIGYVQFALEESVPKTIILNNSVEVGNEVSTGSTGDLYPLEFESNDNGVIIKNTALYHPNNMFEQGQMKVVLKYTNSDIVSNETKTPVACIDEKRSIENLPITSTNIKDKNMNIQYNYLSANQMFDNSLVKERFNKLCKDWYEDDPVGPRTTS